MYLTPHDHREYWIVDIEANGLTPDTVWCVCFKNLRTEEEVTLLEYDEIREFINSRPDAVWIGHNIIGYDAPVLNRLVGCRLASVRLVDTFVLSSLYSPSITGGHSLGAWGDRLKLPKGQHSEWDRLSDEMILYCQQDVRVTFELYKRLTARMLSVGFSDRSAGIEHKAWNIIKKQQKNGFAFDVPRAHQLFSELRAIEEELKKKIYEIWPPTLAPVKLCKQAYKNDGSHTSRFEKHRSEYPHVRLLENGQYECLDYVEFNLGSPKQRIEKLLEVGWKPSSFTPKGSPKVDEDSLTAFALSSGREEVTALAKWVVINSRANMIGNWLDLQKDGLIHGNLWLANTLRYRHDKPNTANIPAVRVDKQTGEPLQGIDGLYTYDSRDLWVTRSPVDRSLVGVDAKGIQLRVLAQYLNNPEFTEQVLKGDPHEYNRQLAGIDTRPKAKTFIYAYLLGAGDAKVASIIGGSLRDGRDVKQRFEGNFRGLKPLLGRLKGELQRTGRITLCDGSRVLVPSDHMVLAYLLQGDESRIMKQAGIYADETIRRERLDVLKVGDIHDEWQSDVRNNHIGRFTEVCEQAFSDSGDSFNYSLPIECDHKVGKTWAETH